MFFQKNIDIPLPGRYNITKDRVTVLEAISMAGDMSIYGERDEVVVLRDEDGKQKSYPHELSGGMKQRVAIAKALALKSDIILMDEPFAALDAMTRDKLQTELIRIHTQSDITIIFITHNIQEALALGTRILVMDRNGNIIIDEENKIPKPVTPASDGYGETWNRLHRALGI